MVEERKLEESQVLGIEKFLYLASASVSLTINDGRAPWHGLNAGKTPAKDHVLSWKEKGKGCDLKNNSPSLPGQSL